MKTQKIPSPLFLLLFVACALSLFSAECQLATGSNSSGNADSGVVTMGLKGTGLSGAYVENTVEFQYMLEGNTTPRTFTEHFKVYPDAAGTYTMKKTFTMKEGNYQFLIRTSSWSSLPFSYTIAAGKQTQIFWTNNSIAQPQVYVY
jgi:hypothetical protein